MRLSRRELIKYAGSAAVLPLLGAGSAHAKDVIKTAAIYTVPGEQLFCS